MPGAIEDAPGCAESHSGHSKWTVSTLRAVSILTLVRKRAKLDVSLSVLLHALTKVAPWVPLAGYLLSNQKAG